MKRGDVVEFTERIAVYSGKKAVVRRVSRQTANVTVELIDDVSEAIKKGTTVTVGQYDLRPAIVTRP